MTPYSKKEEETESLWQRRVVVAVVHDESSLRHFCVERRSAYTVSAPLFTCRFIRVLRVVQ